MKFSFIYITTKDKSEAVALGKKVVQEKLAACANVFDGMTSIYPWQGKINQEPECVLLLKTKSTLVDKVIKRIKMIHSYDNPCIVSWSLDKGSAEYFDWLKENTD